MSGSWTPAAGVPQPLRAVQVGLGGWGLSWARTVLPHTPDLRVVAVADPDAGRRAAFAAATGVPDGAAHPSLAAATAAGPLDAVLVTAGIGAHVPLVRQALEAGLHVLVEKPFTTDLASAAELVALADRVGRRLVVAQNYRYFAAALAVRALLDDGVVGRVQHVDVTFRRHHVVPSSATTPVAAGVAPPDSSVLYQIAVHHLDLLRALLRTEGEAVTARPWRHGQARGSRLSAFSAQVELADGTFVDYSTSWASTVEQTPWTGAWRLEGDAGELRWSGKDPLEGCAVEVRDRRRRVTRPEVTVPAVHDRAAVVAELVRLVREGGASPIEGRANLGTVAMVDACATSLDGGGRTAVQVPTPT